MSTEERVWLEAAPRPFATVEWMQVELTLEFERWLSPLGWISRVGSTWQYGNHGCGVHGSATTMTEALEHFQLAVDKGDAEYVRQALETVEP